MIPEEYEAFVRRFGGVVEHSPWVAEQAFEDGPFNDAATLHAAFQARLFAASHAAQLAVLLAHPELATSKALTTALTAESTSEQAGAGLDRLAEDRRLALAAALREYRERFDFPFIACVRDHGGATLDDLVATRLHADPAAEFKVALTEVSAIARHRIQDLVETP
jgi:2-oxo-4-hydroxy-4-carboxy-5-ureidoimidazoline decarboxylase